MNAPFSLARAAALVAAALALMAAIVLLAGQASRQAVAAHAHADAKGLDGYAGLVALLRAGGHSVALARSAGEAADAAARPGLLVLTPAAKADAGRIAALVARHRQLGPVLVVLPKWQSAGLPSGAPGAAAGWVQLTGVALPEWRGFLDDVRIGPAPRDEARLPAIAALPGAPAARLPTGLAIAGQGPALAPLVRRGAAVLAARYGDDQPWPLTLVFEPDLLDNYGLAQPANAALAEALVAAAGSEPLPITFDLTLAGSAPPAGLLALATSAPFAAVSLCLALAVVVAFWRGLARFGRPLARPAPLAGAHSLIASAARLILRTGRLHLLGPAYAEATRARLAADLALPPGPDADAALDAALERHPDTSPSFTATARRLAEARGQAAILAAAQDLHALERTLRAP